MDIEKKKSPAKTLYEKNTFLIIEDLSAKHDFSLCLLEKNAFGLDEKLKVILLKRDQENGANYFRPDHEAKIEGHKIIFQTEDVQLVKYAGLDGEVNELDHLKIFIKKASYEKIRKKVKEALIERGVKNSEEGDFEEEILIESDLEIEIIDKSQRKKALGHKKLKISKQKASPKITTRQSIEKKVKGSTSKKSKAKMKPPVYKKGKCNPNIQLIQKSAQYESPSPEPDFSCCKLCNNKELLRAALTQNLQLFEKILATKDKISSFCAQTGPDSATSLYSTLLSQRNYPAIFALLEIERRPEFFAAPNLAFGFSAVDTGFNDKYAYGIATRRVEMSRGNREGTNAFLYDSHQTSRVTVVKEQMAQFCRFFDSEEAFLHLLTYESEFVGSLEAAVCQVVLFGNRFLARKLAEKMYLSNGFGFSRFHFLAVAAESPDELLEMKKMNTKKKAFGNSQITPTHMACINPNAEILKRFLELGEEMYVVDELQRKPVHFAAACESTAPLQLLLEKGIDCRDYDKNKMTPLMFAAIAGRPENIRLMCRHVPYAVNLKSKEGQSALHYAVLNNNQEAAAELIGFGANVNLGGRNRMTPLMLAAQRGFFGLAQFLVEKGAKVLPRDKYRKSALLYAVMNGHVKIASFLLERGADFLGCDSSGNSAVHFACAYGQWEMLELLARAGANINAANSWNLAPILVALMKNHYRCVMKLTEFPEIDVNCQDNNGGTLLMNNLGKFTRESLGVVEFLVRRKSADVNLADFSGNNALHLLAMRRIAKQKGLKSWSEAVARFQEDVEIFKGFLSLLVSAGIDVNRRNLKSFTALEIAIDSKNWIFVELLLESPNLDWETRNSNNQTIFHNCHNVFYYKNCKTLLARIFQKVSNFAAFQTTHDFFGYNFYHAIMTSFLESIKINQFMTIYSEKISIYNAYLNSKEIVGNEGERNLLLAKIQRGEAKKASRFQDLIPHFEYFNELLANLHFDFSIPVSLIEEPYKNYQERVQAAGDNKSQFKFPFQNYNPSNYETPINQPESAGKKVDFLINSNAGCTVLHLAMICPKARLVAQLIKILTQLGSYRANFQNFFGETVFFYFASENQGDGEIAKLLLAAGESPDIPSSAGQFPFLLVCQKENRSAFLELLVNNVQLDVKNREGLSPLIHFAKSRKIWEVQQLLYYGADVRICDSKNRNALHWAVNNNSLEDADFALEDALIEKGIDINAVDVRGRAPLHYFFCKIGDPLASAPKDPIEIFSDFLVNRNLKVDPEDVFGNTPLIYAAQRGAYLCLGSLHKRGADLDHLNKDQNSPLAVALLFNKVDVAVYLMQQNVKIDLPCFEIDFAGRLRCQIEQEKKDAKRAKLQIEQEAPVKIRLRDLAAFLGQESDNGQNAQKSRGPLGRYVFGGKTVPRRASVARKAFRIGSGNQEESEQGEGGPGIDFETLKARGFVIRRASIFELALSKKADSIAYLLIAAGFSIGRAVIDSLNAGLFNYALKLLKKKVDEDPEKNAQAFRVANEQGRNIFHVFALKAANLPLDSIGPFFEQLAKKGISASAKDNFGICPILYVALKSKNLALIEKMVSAQAEDRAGNNLLSCFVQNNSALKASFSRGEKSASPVCSKSPLLCKVQNPFGQQFGAGVYQSVALALRAEAEKREKANLRDLLSQQSQFSDEATQLSWIKDFVRRFKLPLNRPFKLLKESPGSLSGVDLFDEGAKTTNLLFYAVKRLHNLKLLQVLIELGVDLNSADEKGHTILTHAIKKNNILLISFLLQFQSAINFQHRDNSGKSYIHHIVSPLKTASYENLALLEFFAGRAGLDAPDAQGRPPLFYALQQDSGVMARHLRLLGAGDFAAPLQRMPTSAIADFEFAERQFDFEEDHKLYLELMKQKFVGSGIEVEQRPEPDPRLKGDLELLWDAASNSPFDVKLVKVDIHYGFYSANLFYLMQIVRDKIRKVHVLFTSWGRVGTEGQFQQTPFFRFEDALREFKKLFKEKTGNEFDQRDGFEKKPNKYRLIKTVKRQIHPNLVKFFDADSEKSVPSKLPPSLKSLMADLTDANMYKIVYSSFQLNPELLPFGNLDKDLIERAQGLLDEMRELAKKMEEGRKKNSLKTQFELASQISEKTSEYLELIPSVGSRTEQIPAFNSGKIQTELVRLNDLRYMEVVSRILAAANFRIGRVNPLDYCFAALGIKIAPLEKGSEEFGIVKMYLKTGIACPARAVLRNVFAVERRGEAERFRPWRSAGPRRLLWHGTRTENLMGIFFNGLRIAPSDGGHNGANLGRGIYFSDAFQRSVPFSSAFSGGLGHKPRYILLAEVGLGKMHKAARQDAGKPLPSGFDSVKGQGYRVHDKNQRVFLSNGCMVPIGDFVQSKKFEADENKNPWMYFEYNEYAVYDPSQVRLRYLLELDSQKIEDCVAQ